MASAGKILTQGAKIDVGAVICSMCVCVYIYIYIYIQARSGAVVWGTALQAGISQVRLPIVSLEFFIDIILPKHYGPGVDPSS